MTHQQEIAASLRATLIKGTPVAFSRLAETIQRLGYGPEIAEQLGLAFFAAADQMRAKDREVGHA